MSNKKFDPTKNPQQVKELLSSELIEIRGGLTPSELDKDDGCTFCSSCIACSSSGVV